ncbi:MAG: hypothetical protein ACI4P3_00110 [Candidatus Spyradosoma sp.]
MTNTVKKIALPAGPGKPVGFQKNFGFAEKKRLASRFFFAKSNLRKETGPPSPLVFHAISK